MKAKIFGGVLTKFLMYFLKSVGPRDLERAVRTNISLPQLFYHHAPYYLKMARGAARLCKNQRNLFNTQNSLEWLSKTSPEMAIMITKNPVILQWFDEQIRGLNQLIFGK